jgi:hypothetical protein
MLRRAVAILILGCTLSTGALAADFSQLAQDAKPVDIRIVSQPEDETNRGLLMATWIMVIANALLCAVTWVGARNQSKDMRESIAVAEKAAGAAGRSADAAVRSSDSAGASAQLASRQKREMLQRETNIVAHRVAIVANRVGELAVLTNGLGNQLFRDYGASPEKQKVDEMLARRQQAADNATAVLASSLVDKPDESLAGDLRQLDEHLVKLEGFKEELSEEIADRRRAVRENTETMRRMQDKAEQMMRRPGMP